MIAIRRLIASLFTLCLFAPGIPWAQSVEIEGADGAVLVKLAWDGERVKVKDAAGETLLKGKPRDDGGRKYKGSHGDVVAKVSGNDEAFKLKTERGGLLWKIKYYGERIKISPNEGNALAEVLRRKSEDKWVLERDGEAYGKVRFYGDTGDIKVKDAAGKLRYRVRGERLSPLYGVLLIPGMQAEEAFIIMAEIWLRGW